MKIIKSLLPFVLIVLSCESKEKIEKVKQTQTVLIGEVNGRPNSKTLLMAKSYEDFRNDSIVKIPIVDCSFSYAFNVEEIESYHLAFEEEVERGAYRAVTFFSEKDTIRLTLNNNEAYAFNKVVGGKVNAEYQNYQSIMKRDFYSRYDSIRKKYEPYDYKEFQSIAYREVMEQLSKAKTQEEKVPLYQKQKKLQEEELDKSGLGKIQEAEYKSINDDMVNYRYNYIAQNKSLVSFDLLLSDMIGFDYKDVPLDKVLEVFNVLKIKYEDHPYSEMGQNLIFGITSLKEGGSYINFTAPDINGKQYELKSILKDNKIVLLNLWATWCGPCITKTRLMEPIYEKYKEKGFTILGVAGEFKNLKRYNSFMSNEKWEWKQLIELDKENKIWEKYGVMNSGGGMFLISSSGELLAVDPTAEDVEAILEEKLVSKKIKL